MRIAIVDGSGGGLGLALGLADLGHGVGYRGPEPWPGDAATAGQRRRAELLARCGADLPGSESEADLLVLVDAFADQLAALEGGMYGDAPLAIESPLRAHLNPRIVPHRRELFLDLAARARAVAVVDVSDRSVPRERAFETLSHATLLAREVPLGAVGAWRPLPFLYNEVLLWIERCVTASDWFLPLARRRPVMDWVFCGTVAGKPHARRRAQLLAEVQQRWPQHRGGLATGISFVQVLSALQAARGGLDLPGEGELCFRVHECLQLGLPLLRPWPFAIAMPNGIEAAFATSPDGLSAIDGEVVTTVYRERYAPAVAAQALLDAVSTRDVGDQLLRAPLPTVGAVTAAAAAR